MRPIYGVADVCIDFLGHGASTKLGVRTLPSCAMTMPVDRSIEFCQHLWATQFNVRIYAGRRPRLTILVS